MAEAETNQRIAAILAADAAGYTRLMAADEVATIAAQAPASPSRSGSIAP